MEKGEKRAKKRKRRKKRKKKEKEKKTKTKVCFVLESCLIMGILNFLRFWFGE